MVGNCSKNGDHRAIYNIALAYSEGIHYKKNLNKAIKLFIECTQVFNDAFVVIGDIYRFEKEIIKKLLTSIRRLYIQKKKKSKKMGTIHLPDYTLVMNT